MRLPYLVRLCSLVFLVPYAAAAQDSAKPDFPGGNLVAKADLVLRDSPPNPWFYFKGDKVGVISAGDKVIATDQKVVGTLYGKFLWLKVGKFDPKTGNLIATGWVYAGANTTPSYFAKSDPLLAPKDSAKPSPERQYKSREEKPNRVEQAPGPGDKQ